MPHREGAGGDGGGDWTTLPRDLATPTRFILFLVGFVNRGSFFAAIYMTWRSWPSFLLLFTTVGDRASHFCCYLHHLASMGLIFAAIYYGLRARTWKKHPNHCKYCRKLDFVVFRDSFEIIHFIAYTNRNIDLGRAQKPQIVAFATVFTTYLLSF